MNDRHNEGREREYRQKAIAARAKAEVVKDVQIRATLLQMAAIWEAMAKGGDHSSGSS
jgi:hypothetical protein